MFYILVLNAKGIQFLNVEFEFKLVATIIVFYGLLYVFRRIKRTEMLKQLCGTNDFFGV